MLNQNVRSESQLQNYPFLFQATGKIGCSDRYLPIRSMDIIEPLMNRGWVVNSVQATAARKSDNSSYVKHMVRMARPELKTNEGVPEIVLINSLDRTSFFNIASGFLRFVCSNQTILGDMLTKYKFRHLTSYEETLGAIINSFDKIEEDLHRIIPKIEELKSIEMAPDQRGVYCMAVMDELDIKLPADKYRNIPLDRANRWSDKNVNNLWTVANSVQENLIKGNYYYESEDSRIISAKKVGNVDRMMRINEVVFNKALEWMPTDAFLN